jgi:endonuclease/exonuclease/phosphatase family metal-dependent hydrolase
VSRFNAENAKVFAKDAEKFFPLRTSASSSAPSAFKELVWLSSIPMKVMLQILLVLLSALAISLIATAQEHSETSKLLESGQATKLANPATAPTEIKIVSYNIRWRSGKKLQQIIDWLKDKNERPAIIALQEVDRAKKRTGHVNHARTLAEGLGMYYAWAAPPAPQSKKASEEETGVELLSPYPLTNITRIVLPHKGPGSRWRVALGATVKIDRLSLRVYSVHSETRIPVPLKIEQLGAVLEDLTHYPLSTPAIVMGDFNSWEPSAKSRVRKLFSSAGFTTPFSDDEHTFTRNAILFDLELKLDWIWLRGLLAPSYGIDRSLTVSDHFPLWTVVDSKKSGAGQFP